MKRVSMSFAALVLVACTTATAPAAPFTALQEAASLMVSIGQHGEGISTADITDLSAQLDERLAAAPDDPFVLKLVAQSHRALSDLSQDRAQRVALRHAALAELDKAILLAGDSTASRIVTLNGVETEIDLKDLPDLRAQLMQQVQTDR
jgi:hypothetical protein